MPPDHPRDSQARPRGCAVLCCDAAFLPYAAFAGHRIRLGAPDLDVLICSNRPLPIPPALGLSGRVIETGGAFDALDADARVTAATYLRLALPDALAGDYDRLFYLDCDIHVHRGAGARIAALLGAQMGGCPVAAVRDTQQWRSPDAHLSDMRALGLPPGPYLNAGVMMIDIPAWRRAGLTGEALAFGADHAGRLEHRDQTLLNAVLQGRWAELSPVWNWQYTRASRMFEAMTAPHLVHFIGAVKPWADPEGRLAPRFAAALAAFMAEHFPDLPRPAPGRGPLAIPGAARHLAWRHLLAADRIEAYLARFAHDLEIRT
ncbi:glycosyltransferase family 8 protein [Profundibacterium mesophilum]|uniref:Lipopolysaccharide 1 n=1 Tax=Profundibacterium mesophilum KAUST100406-0324 TaxID=1037889 RepID=A0A921NQE1_9RHOB|nr:glycosyltransferase family 8 protein [Profundibacterium mesophilum]KAF0676297.1 lipopolysaccharide 1 [Profundibacterium mesophilum KAUST100406-0324]